MLFNICMKITRRYNDHLLFYLAHCVCVYVAPFSSLAAFNHSLLYFVLSAVVAVADVSQS